MDEDGKITGQETDSSEAHSQIPTTMIEPNTEESRPPWDRDVGGARGVVFFFVMRRGSVGGKGADVAVGARSWELH